MWLPSSRKTEMQPADAGTKSVPEVKLDVHTINLNYNITQM